MLIANERMDSMPATGPAVTPLCADATTAPRWQASRNRLREYVDKNPVSGATPDEIEAHFEGMPPQYWERVSEAELSWGLQSVHKFFHGLVATESGGTPAVVSWRHFPRLGCTKVIVATWDRAGLLTRIAGYVSALRMNIVRAEIYTRADNIVLDVFWLCDSEHHHINDSERLRQLGFLIEGGLSEPPRFVSTWTSSSHQFLPRGERALTKVTFYNAASSDHTVLVVEAQERLGLLHDIVHALSQLNVNISEALIDTVGEVARDLFYVTDERKRKITDTARLAAIEAAITDALT